MSATTSTAATMSAFSAVADTVAAVLAAGSEVGGVLGKDCGRAVEFSLLGRCVTRGLVGGVMPVPKGVAGSCAGEAAEVRPVAVPTVFRCALVCPPLKSWRVAWRGMAYSRPAGLPGSTWTPVVPWAHTASAMGHRLEAMTHAMTPNRLGLTPVSMPSL